MLSRAHFCRNLVFCDFSTLCSDSSTFGVLGAQVGATLGPKSCQKGVRAAKLTSNRAARGGQSSNSWSGEVRLSVRVMERAGNQADREASESKKSK